MNPFPAWGLELCPRKFFRHVCMQITHISCNVTTTLSKDRLVPKLKLQKLDFWLNLDKKVARHLPCHVQWWRRLWHAVISF
jgi:hypothetical protein